MGREMPPAPNAWEAREYADRLHEVKDLASGGRSRRRSRKSGAGDRLPAAGALADSPAVEAEHGPWQELLSSSAHSEEGLGWHGEAKGDVGENLDRAVPKSQEQSSQHEAACCDVASRNRHSRAGRRVRPPQRRQKIPEIRAARDKGKREITLAVVVSAVTSLAVCLLMGVSQNGGAAFVAKLLGSGWSM